MKVELTPDGLAPDIKIISAAFALFDSSLPADRLLVERVVVGPPAEYNFRILMTDARLFRQIITMDDVSDPTINTGFVGNIFKHSEFELIRDLYEIIKSVMLSYPNLETLDVQNI